MPMQRGDVITSVGRRRRWSLAEMARSGNLHVSQLFRWRKQLCTRTERPATETEPLVEPKQVPVTVVPMAAATDTPSSRRRPRRSRMMEIEMRGPPVSCWRRRRGAAPGPGRPGRTMIPVLTGVRVWLGTGHTDMCWGPDSIDPVGDEGRTIVSGAAG